MNKKISKGELRHNARCAVMQALYQWHYNHDAPSEVLHQFKQSHDLSTLDLDYFDVLFLGTTQHAVEIDQQLTPLLDRQLDELDPVALATLRYASFELIHRLDTPYKVVLNEALKVIKVYGPEDSFKFVNAVLDKLAAQVRSVEYAK